MSQILSHINPKGPEFKSNYEHNEELCRILRERQHQAVYDRPQHIIDRQRARGKLLFRERIEAILDDRVLSDAFVRIPLSGRG